MNDMERLNNKPYEIEIGTRGKRRRLRLEEPPMMELLTLMREETERLVAAYIGHRKLFEKLTSGGTGLNLIEFLPLLEPIFGEICDIIEVLDSVEGEPEYRIADIIEANQFLSLLPHAMEIINAKELQANFTKALGTLGIDLTASETGDEEAPAAERPVDFEQAERLTETDTRD